MQTNYQARWISRRRGDAIKRANQLGQAILLDTFNGLVLVEPIGADLADGSVLSEQEAEYELQPAWYLGPTTRLREARRRLGLEIETPSERLTALEV